MADDIKQGVRYLDADIAAIYDYLLRRMTEMDRWLEDQSKNNLHAGYITIELTVRYDIDDVVLIGSLDGAVQVYRRTEGTAAATKEDDADG